MENKKCSSKMHNNNDAISYCEKCNIFMCKKCENLHNELFQEHNSYNIKNNLEEIFTGFCMEKDHLERLQYYCKDHNKLCCASCITKIKGKGYGQHTDCQICFIEDIKEEKQNAFMENIKILENLSNSMEQSITKLKMLVEKVDENKESLKKKIQKIFTKIRNILNEREEVLLLEVDKKFENLFLKENIIQQYEKLPEKIILSLDKGKKIKDEWSNINKLNFIINECIKIENNIKNIILIDNYLKKGNNSNININFIPDQENEISQFLEYIKSFGKIYDNIIYGFNKCPENIIKEKKYEIRGERNNIVIKKGIDRNYTPVICENILNESKIYKWKITILKSSRFIIYIGIAPSDLNIYLNDPFYHGWYFKCSNAKLYSGPPHNFEDRNSGLKKPKKEIIVIMDMSKRSLKFIIDKEDRGISYNNIPIDKPLTPSIILNDIDDSVEISEC